ncbi:MAG TPA: PfkB family carbohydrate kinase [Clostridiales bacterium]|nr:PfkB family carbohydrate kinase [Clostridiales bacterium]
MYRTAAVPVSEVVDTPGCGDSYIAAFCADYFRGGTIQSAMETGSLAASRVLSRRGGAENGIMTVLR